MAVTGDGSRFRACGVGSARSDASVGSPKVALGMRALLRARPACLGGELACRNRFAAPVTLPTMRAVVDGLRSRMALPLVTGHFPMLCRLATCKVT